MRTLDTDARQLVHFALGVPLLCGPPLGSLLGPAVLTSAATIALMLAGMVLTSAGTARDPHGDRVRADAQKSLDNLTLLVVLLLTLATCLSGDALPALVLASAGAASAVATLATDYTTGPPCAAEAAIARTGPAAAGDSSVGHRHARSFPGVPTGPDRGERPDLSRRPQGPGVAACSASDRATVSWPPPSAEGGDVRHGTRLDARGRVLL